MPNLDVRSIAVCIQALDDAIRYYDLLSQSETTDSNDYEEARYMYEVELGRLCDVYSREEAQGNVDIPLDRLIKSHKT